MMKKLEKGSNLASSKAQQKNPISSKANTTKSKKHKKGYAMVVDYMDMSGLCVHIRVRPTSVKRPNKRPQTSWPNKRKVMDKALVS